MPENALLVYKLLFRAVTPLKRSMGLYALMLFAAFNALQGATDKGIQLYEAENYPKAKAWYEKQLPSPTHRPYAQYNLGCIAYQEQDYAKAQEAFEAALHTPSPDLQEKAFYNLGNTAFQQASQASTNVQEAIQHLEKAIQAYTNSLDLNANNPKAKANCELAQKELERLKDQAKEKDEAQSKDPTPEPPKKDEAEDTSQNDSQDPSSEPKPGKNQDSKPQPDESQNSDNKHSSSPDTPPPHPPSPQAQQPSPQPLPQGSEPPTMLPPQNDKTQPEASKLQAILDASKKKEQKLHFQHMGSAGASPRNAQAIKDW